VHAASGAEPLHTYNCFEITADALDDVVALLVKQRTAAARAKVPGLDARRADIIVAGALVLATIAETFEVRSYLYSEGALREGVLLDTISRRGGGTEVHHLRDVSRRSIRQLVDRCDDDPAHSVHVAGLAVELFDAIPEVRALGPAAREYLEAGALLANVGLVVAHSQHHLHAYYVIRNCELAGLTDNEIEVIAQIARYHRKSEPKQSHSPFASLGADDQHLVRSLAAVLRVAIGLDRRHERRVAGVRAAADGGTLVIRALAADGADIGLEVFAAGERKALLERVLDCDVEVVAG
jgi:exopolyphosphatase/guanosine-5'-triphosphate,3'-diphosphate pyrophosphatase